MFTLKDIHNELRAGGCKDTFKHILCIIMYKGFTNGQVKCMWHSHTCEVQYARR